MRRVKDRPRADRVNLSYCNVTGTELSDGGVLVQTEKGPVKARQVTICAGPWAPEVGRMLGVEIPIRPVRG